MKTLTQSVEEATQNVAKELNIEPAQLQTMRVNWDSYMKMGLIVRVHIGRWRGRGLLSMDDLGIPEDKVSDLIRLGEKRLLPIIPSSSKYYSETKKTRTYGQLLDSLDTACRSHLKANSYQTYWGSFVPVTNFEKYRSEFESEYVPQYLGIRDEIVATWDLIIQQLRDEYRKVAEASFLRMMRLGEDVLRARNALAMEEFTQKFLDRIEAMLPTREQFNDSFYIEARYSYIPLPDLLAKEQAEKQAIYERSETESVVEQARRQAALETITLARDVERSQLETELLEERAKQRMNESVIEARERQLREMNRVVLEEAERQKKTQIDDFITTVSGQIRQMILDVVVNVQESVQKNNGKLVGKTAQQLRNLIDNVEQLNFTDDAEIAAMLAPIKAATVEQDKKTRNVAVLSTQLEELTTTLRSQLLSLEQINRSSRTEEVSVAIAPAELRRGSRDVQEAEVAPVTVRRGMREV